MELHKRGPETDGEPANGEMKPEEEEGEEQVLLSASTFEDLLELVGTRGRWNVLLFFTATYAYFVSPMLIMSYQFLGATPEHWCLVEPLIEANWTQDQVLSFAIPLSSSGGYDSCHMYDYNYTAAAAMGYEAAMDDLKGSTNHTILCRTRDFNHTQYQSTVVTEWDLVCERRPLYSTTQSILSAGSILGLLVGFLFDKYGRRAVILRIIVLYLFLANVIIFSPNVVVYIIIRAITSCLDISLYVGTFVVVMETCATRYRSAVGALTVVPWAVGNMFTATVAYFIRDWKLLTICLALPLLLIVSYFWLLPESPLWLLHVGRYERALVELKKAAKMNGKTLPPDHQLLRTMRSVDRRVTL